MINPIGGIVSGITGLISTWLDGKNQKAKAKQAVIQAELENKARLLRDKESNNSAWEIATLRDKDKLLRRTSFVMFAAPLVLAMFDPSAVKEYFDTAIQSMPDWWIKSFMGITGSIWGLSSLKNIVPSLLDSFRKGKPKNVK